MVNFKSTTVSYKVIYNRVEDYKIIPDMQGLRKNKYPPAKPKDIKLRESRDR